MKHVVRWDEDNQCAWLEFDGEITPAHVDALLPMLQALIEGRRRLLLIDHQRSQGMISGEARAAFVQRGAQLELAKMAFTGLSPLNRMIARVVTKLNGKSEYTRFFQSSAEALAWLREP